MYSYEVLLYCIVFVYLCKLNVFAIKCRQNTKLQALLMVYMCTTFSKNLVIVLISLPLSWLALPEMSVIPLCRKILDTSLH